MASQHDLTWTRFHHRSVDTRRLTSQTTQTATCVHPAVIEKHYGVPPGRYASWTTAAAAGFTRELAVAITWIW